MIEAAERGAPAKSPDRHLELLEVLKISGDRDQLRSQLEASRRLFPASEDIASFAFRAALDEGDLAGAAHLLSDVVWPLAPDAAARLRRVEDWLKSSATDEALGETLLGLLGKDPRDTAALVGLAMLDLRRKRHAETLRWLERAEAEGPLPQAANVMRIEALLAAGEWDDAFGRALDAALLASPDQRRLHALKYDFHEKRGEAELARAALRLARERFPEDPWFAMRAFRSDISDGRLEDAARLFGDLIWRSSLPEATRRGALATVTREWKARDGLKPYLERLLANQRDDRFVLVKLASLATRLRRHVEAARYLEQAKRHGPLPREAASMQVNLLVLEGDAEGSLALAKRLLETHPERKDLVRRVNILASICGNQDDVTQTIRQAILRWPTDASIVQRYNRTVVPEAEDQNLFERLVDVSESAQTDGRWRYQFALACLRRNDTPRACAVLRGLVDDPLVSLEARRLLSLLGVAPAGEWDARARFSNDSTADVRVLEKPSARATFVVMAGLHGGLGNLPLSHLDVLLQDHPINVVYLRDNRWKAFTAGVGGLGPDEPSTISALRDLCAGLGRMPVVTFGGSLAGWSAMRYGALAGAQVALSLAGPVSLAPRDGRPAARFTQHYLSRMLPEAADDLLDLLAASETRVMHVHSAENEKDLANAARLRSLRNVTLMPVDDCDDHFVAAHIVARGQFHPLIEQAIAMAEVSPSLR